MELLRTRHTIPFMQKAYLLNAISLFTFFLGAFFIFARGLHFSIEFTGGVILELNYHHTAPIEKIRSTISNLGYSDFQVQNFGTSHNVTIRLPATIWQNLNSQGDSILKLLREANPDVVLNRTEFIGPQIGQELLHNSVLALLFLVVCTVFYLSLRFSWKLAVSSILANLHDIFIILGFFAFFQWEFSLSTLAGVLAVLGYSINESVIVIDRIRENFLRYRNISTLEIINSAITQTMSRTVVTHSLTQVMVLSMLFFGGPALYYLALALTIGIWSGIYSSVFIAAALAMWMGIRREDIIKQRSKF